MTCSWLYHEGTVTKVETVSAVSGGRRGAEQQQQEEGMVRVETILSEAVLGKFRAKFGDHDTEITFL